MMWEETRKDTFPMKKKLLWITETALMLALLVTLQYFTKPLGQIVTGSCVNTVLAVAVLVGGLWCGLTVALISPVMAFLLNIAPQILTVPTIMAGNAVFVILLHFLADRTGKQLPRQIAAWLLAAMAKFALLYLVVVKLVCGVLSEGLLASGAMKPPMLQLFPQMFGLPQLITALIGGAIALIISPLIRKALHR